MSELAPTSTAPTNEFSGGSVSGKELVSVSRKELVSDMPSTDLVRMPKEVVPYIPERPWRFVDNNKPKDPANLLGGYDPTESMEWQRNFVRDAAKKEAFQAMVGEQVVHFEIDFASALARANEMWGRHGGMSSIRALGREPMSVMFFNLPSGQRGFDAPSLRPARWAPEARSSRPELPPIERGRSIRQRASLLAIEQAPVQPLEEELRLAEEARQMQELRDFTERTAQPAITNLPTQH